MSLPLMFSKSEFMRPSILLILATLFIIAFSSELPGMKAVVVILASVLAFLLGEIWADLKFKPQLKISKPSLYYFGLSLIVISLVALYADFFTAGGIPLFNSALRRFLNPVLTYTAFLMVPGAVFTIASLEGHKNAKILTLTLIGLTAAMMALLGYRTEVLAAIIAPVLTAYYCKIFRFRDLAIFAVLAFAAFVGLSFIRTGGMAFSSRATTTITAFDTLVSSTPIFGSTTGYIQFADFIKILTKIPMYGGRILTGTLIGARPGVSITTTLYGPPYADFGVFGLAFMFFFGLMMGAGYKASKNMKGVYAAVHSLLLAFILLGVETGIADGIIWMYFILVGVFYFISHKYES